MTRLGTDMGEKGLVLLFLSTFAVTQAHATTCPPTTPSIPATLNFTCPTSFTGAKTACYTTSLKGPLIIRCTNGCPVINTCSDVLLSTPPEGAKPDAVCWDDGTDDSNDSSVDASSTEMAQCTADCIAVTFANGTTFYPLGCSSLNDNGTAPTGADGASTSKFHAQTDGGSVTVVTTSSVHLAPGPVVVSSSKTTSDASTTGASGSGSGSSSAAAATKTGNAAAKVGKGGRAQEVLGGVVVGLGAGWLF